ncbi:MAG: hypothetical protein ACON35_02315 [Candidatus Marinamargulisbacteria bacterium]
MEISAKTHNNTIPANAMDQSLRTHHFEDTLDNLMAELANDQKVNPNHKIVSSLLDDIHAICNQHEHTTQNDSIIAQLNQRLQSLVVELKRHCCRSSLKTALKSLSMLTNPPKSVQQYTQTLTAMLAA